jgi:hypothetical protein
MRSTSFVDIKAWGVRNIPSGRVVVNSSRRVVIRAAQRLRLGGPRLYGLGMYFFAALGGLSLRMAGGN